MLAFVRPVPASYARATVRHASGGIDVDRARVQHAAYVAALRAAGCQILPIAAADELPDSCFVEDHAVVCGGRALACRVGHPGRRAESPAVAEALAAHVEVVPMTEGNLDGGDVLRVGRTLFVGLSDRTDDGGVRALREVFPDHRVVPVPVGDRLHLKCVASRLDDETVVLADGTLDPAVFAGLDVVAVPADEAYAANVVAIGRTVLVAAGFPRTAARLAARGDVVPIDVSENRKGDGSLTCLSILVGSAR